MNISNLIDRLNNELNKLNNLRNEEFNKKDFFTNNEHFNDTHDEYIDRIKNNSENISETSEDSELISDTNNSINTFQDIEPDNKTKSLVTVKPNYLLTAQTMFKKTIKFSLKSFLISISLSFLNLFV